MTMRNTAILLILVACSSSPPHLGTSAAALTSAGWTRTDLYPGDATCNGADGTDSILVGQGDLWIASGCEQSGKIVLVKPTGGPVAGSVSHVEDAKLGDLDGSGTPATVGFSQDKLIKILWSTGTATTLVNGQQQWMAGAIADIDGDGVPDIIAGGRRQTAPAAHLKWWRNPGGQAAHTAANWTEHDIGTTGLTLSVFVDDVDQDGDADIVEAEREWIWNGTLHDVSHAGVGLWTQTPGTVPTWSYTRIDAPAHGDQKMISLYDWDGDGWTDVLTTSSNAQGWNLSGILVGGNGWARNEVAQPSGVGEVHAAAAGDLSGDGLPDLVFTYAEAYDPGESGVVLATNLGDGTFDYEDIGGDEGDKYDDVQIVVVAGVLCALTSEQHADTDHNGTVGPGLGVAEYCPP